MTSLRVVASWALLGGAPLALVVGQDSIPAHGHAVLHGEVRGSSERPVGSAVVSVFGSGRSATTNEQGEFSVTGLPAGTHVVQVVATGYKVRLLPVGLSDSTPALTISLLPNIVVLDSVRVVATTPHDSVARRRDRITEVELSHPDVIGGTAADAFALLRPELFVGRPPTGFSATTEASRKGQAYRRDQRTEKSTGKSICVGVRICDIDGLLAVSINEGPLGSPDVLTTLSVRTIKEMRYLLPVEAGARFGVTTGGGPVLIIYTR